MWYTKRKGGLYVSEICFPAVKKSNKQICVMSFAGQMTLYCGNLSLIRWKIPLGFLPTYNYKNSKGEHCYEKRPLCQGLFAGRYDGK